MTEIEIKYDGTNMDQIRDWGAVSHHDRVMAVSNWITLAVGDTLKHTKDGVIVLNSKRRARK